MKLGCATPGWVGVAAPLLPAPLDLRHLCGCAAAPERCSDASIHGLRSIVCDLENHLADWTLAGERRVSVLREENREPAKGYRDPHLGSILEKADVVGRVEITVRSGAQGSGMPADDVGSFQRHMNVNVPFVI